MRKSVFILFLLIFFSSLTAGVFAKYSVVSKRIYIQDRSNAVIAYIEPDGTVLNGANSIIGYINPDGSVLNSSYSARGYIESDGRILNSSYKKIAYLHTDGSVLDPSYSPLAYIRNGCVIDPSYKTILYFDTPVSARVIAVFFIFFYWEVKKLASLKNFIFVLYHWATPRFTGEEGFEPPTTASIVHVSFSNKSKFFYNWIVK